jgi:starch phosphorylase
MLRPFRTLNVTPSLPERLDPLYEIAHNVWWSWTRDAVDLFRRLDPDLFDATHHNPVETLGRVSQERLDDVSQDEGFLSHMDRVYRELQDYVGGAPALEQGGIIAYFSMEYGLTEAMPIYSGGLGVLSGDHLKTASDMGLPLVGVGMLYQEGYFRQYLNADGWQQETYPTNDFHNMPIRLERDAAGAPLTISVSYPGREVLARIWRVQVGRAPLYMLDTNLEGNAPEDRQITSKLYSGDKDMRIRQEILLGVGGMRALQAVGIEPTVCHMNEGHSAFLGLERIRIVMERQGLSFDEALTLTAAGNVFTTHTSVPAGIDLFPPYLVDRYLGEWMHLLGIDRDRFMALGRPPQAQAEEPFSMAVLALSLSSGANGVSALHGQIAREMWQSLWPGTPAHEVPISAITNGIHHPSWISRDMANLLLRYLGPRWQSDPANAKLWERMERIPDEELWQTHERRRERLVGVARRHVGAQLERRGASQSDIAHASGVLDPKALTIGFARRFATYKRALLLFHDLERLSRILNQTDRPVQILFAGKAHPEDNPAKELIRSLVHACRRPDLRDRIVFLEDYDMALARYLVQGVDVWLNTPRHGQEASGTSGMKACMNGAIHLSTYDGWWYEGYASEIGWRIGQGEIYQDDAYGDEVEANALYDMLEKDVVPLFYDRGNNSVPHGWVALIKRSMASVGPRFCTNRMLQEYADHLYHPAMERYAQLDADGAQAARELAQWLQHVRAAWPGIRLVDIASSARDDVTVRDEIEFRARVHLGALSPEDVSVQVCLGRTGAQGGIQEYDAIEMAHRGTDDGGHALYQVGARFVKSGLSGFTIRVLPRHPGLATPHIPGLVLWAE